MYLYGLVLIQFSLYALFKLIIYNKTDVTVESVKIKPTERNGIAKDLEWDTKGITFKLLNAKVANEKVDADYAIILIFSAINNTHLRRSIRESWGKDANMKKDNTHKYFVLGKSKLDAKNRVILMEMAKFNDIIRLDILDDYYTLSEKSIAAFQWINKYHKNVKYVLKQDDDAYVNITRLKNRVQSIERRGAKDFMAGFYFHGRKPKRHPLGKYYTPFSLWPNDTWPPCLTGPAYIFSTSIIPRLIKRARDPATPFVKYEDIYITGVLRHFENISIYDIEDMRHIDCQKIQRSYKRQHVSYHRVSAENHRNLYANGRCKPIVMRRTHMTAYKTDRIKT